LVFIKDNWDKWGIKEWAKNNFNIKNVGNDLTTAKNYVVRNIESAANWFGRNFKSIFGSDKPEVQPIATPQFSNFKSIQGWQNTGFVNVASSGINQSIQNTNGNTDPQKVGPRPRKESIQDSVKKYLTGQKKEFFGANISLVSYSGSSHLTLFGTIHTSEVTFYNYLIKGFQIQSNGLLHPSTMLLMHEYGHVLHAQYAPSNFYGYGMWSSLTTARYILGLIKIGQK
jgi:hypothetical protein